MIITDECFMDPKRCEQTCVNTAAGYKCGCNAGFKLAKDETSCYGKVL